MSKEIEEKRKKIICELVQEEMYSPMKEKEMAAFMQVPKSEREEFRRILDELLAEGRISITAKGKYMKQEESVITGTFISNARGFGFVEAEGRAEDLFIPEQKVNGAFHHDVVQARILPGQRGKRGCFVS